MARVVAFIFGQSRAKAVVGMGPVEVVVVARELVAVAEPDDEGFG